MLLTPGLNNTSELALLFLVAASLSVRKLEIQTWRGVFENIVAYSSSFLCCQFLYHCDWFYKSRPYYNQITCIDSILKGTLGASYVEIDEKGNPIFIFGWQQKKPTPDSASKFRISLTYLVLRDAQWGSSSRSMAYKISRRNITIIYITKYNRQALNQNWNFKQKESRWYPVLLFMTRKEQMW